jgi:hypothetical protein
MSYRKSLVMLALSAICGHGYAQTEAPRYRFERVPTQSPTAVTTGDASDLNDAGAVVGRSCRCRMTPSGHAAAT